MWAWRLQRGLARGALWCFGPGGQHSGQSTQRASPQQQACTASCLDLHAGPEHAGPEHAGPENADPEHADPEHADPEHGPVEGRSKEMAGKDFAAPQQCSSSASAVPEHSRQNLSNVSAQLPPTRTECVLEALASSGKACANMATLISVVAGGSQILEDPRLL